MGAECFGGGDAQADIVIALVKAAIAEHGAPEFIRSVVRAISTTWLKCSMKRTANRRSPEFALANPTPRTSRPKLALMKATFLLILAVATTLFAQDGFTPLFNGKDLTG